jgi:repressor LexA
VEPLKKAFREEYASELSGRNLALRESDVSNTIQTDGVSTMQLTVRQQQILDFIRSFKERRGSAPSLREIMEEFGFRSPATVTSHLDLMEKKGVIRRESHRSRNIILTDFASRSLRPSDLLEIPLLGTIPAGMPDRQEQESQRCVTVDIETIHLPKNTRTFALEVRGDSMVNAGILDRDVVIMELAEPRNRDIVAALIDGETTLKRFLLQRGKPFLRAENPAYPDLIPARELVIQGVFRALIRINRSRG